MYKKILISLFVIFSFYYVFFIDTISDSYKMLFKLIPMVLCILIALIEKGSAIIPYKTLLTIALVFCAIGDYTIQWFIIGLSFFLIGHLFYIGCFITTKEQRTPIWIKIILLLFGGIMMVWIGGTLLKNNDTVLAIAVCAYIVVILTMGWTSYRTGSKFAIIGAILFIISDSILAINRFIFNIEFSHQLIMSTYYGAQILMALSIASYSAIRNKSDTIEEQTL